MIGRSCKIKIDGGNDQVFFPNAPIHGDVVYKAAGSDCLQSVMLDLRGVLKISPSKKGSSAAANANKSQETVEFFHISQKILSEAVWTEGNTLTWPFTIVLPEFTGPDRSHDVYADAGNPLFEESPHPLPPNMGSDQSNEVEISYHMYAVAKRRGRFFGSSGSRYGSGDQMAAMAEVHNIPSLLYVPDPPQTHGPISTKEIEQTLDSTTLKPKLFHMKSSGSNLVDHGITKGRSAFVAAKVPTTIVLGEAIDVDVYLTPNSKLEGTVVSLKSLTASLRALTHRRTAKTPHNSALTETTTKRLGTDASKGHVPLDSTPLGFTFATFPIRAWPPTFRSYSASRFYELIIEAIVVQGKEEFKIEYKTEVEAIRKLGEADIARRESAAPPTLPPLGPRGDERLPDYYEEGD